MYGSCLMCDSGHECSRYIILFFTYFTDSSKAPVDTGMFYDNYHLYCRGTAIYSEWIADEFTMLR